MKGVGMTMEGSENNPVMFELLCELPWRPARFDKDEWLKTIQWRVMARPTKRFRMHGCY